METLTEEQKNITWRMNLVDMARFFKFKYGLIDILQALHLLNLRMSMMLKMQ